MENTNPYEKGLRDIPSFLSLFPSEHISKYYTTLNESLRDIKPMFFTNAALLDAIKSIENFPKVKLPDFAFMDAFKEGGESIANMNAIFSANAKRIQTITSTIPKFQFSNNPPWNESQMDGYHSPSPGNLNLESFAPTVTTTSSSTTTTTTIDEETEIIYWNVIEYSRKFYVNNRVIISDIANAVTYYGLGYALLHCNPVIKFLQWINLEFLLGHQ